MVSATAMAGDLRRDLGALIHHERAGARLHRLRDEAMPVEALTAEGHEEAPGAPPASR